jgi:hypothetical protein
VGSTHEGTRAKAPALVFLGFLEFLEFLGGSKSLQERGGKGMKKKFTGPKSQPSTG